MHDNILFTTINLVLPNRPIFVFVIKDFSWIRSICIFGNIKSPFCNSKLGFKRWRERIQPQRINPLQRSYAHTPAGAIHPPILGNGGNPSRIRIEPSVSGV